jgi:uncharacterized protein YbjT (DUF2867 family)
MTDISNPSRTIVVLGATGQQGGGVVRALAADGRWRIRTISRNPDSDAARSLADRGIEVVAGDMDDAPSLRRVFENAHGVFSVQGTDQGGEVETRRGIAVADAAKAAGVAHFIYSSVGGADRSSGVPHFESKWRVEEYVREIGLPASIVRPAFFMENFAKPSLRMTIMGMIRAWVPKTKPLQMIAVDDIGKWVAHAFAHPETFIGKAEEIAGDELTRPEIVAAFKRHGWYPALPIPLPRLAFRPLPYDIRKMMEWFGTDGYTADIPALRARHPDLLTFDQWLSAQASARPIA